jgi:hypothetical protein
MERIFLGEIVKMPFWAYGCLIKENVESQWRTFLREPRIGARRRLKGYQKDGRPGCRDRKSAKTGVVDRVRLRGNFLGSAA